MKLESLLCFGGTEVSDGNRTLAYIQQCLGGQGWQIGGRGDDCDCAVFAEVGGYESPEADPAPWYEPTRPESADFLGLILGPELLDVHDRRTASLVNGSATIGPLRPGARVLACEAMMVASSRAGMAYGERWLSEVLAGSLCREDCAADEAEVMTFCDEAAYRQLLRVGIVDGPIFSDTTTESDSVVQKASFQLMAGVPYLFSRPEECFAGVLGPTDEECCSLVGPDWTGSLATRLRLTAPDANDVTGITITLTPTSGEACPDDNYSPAVTYYIDVLAAATRLTIDSRSRSITKRVPSTRQEVPGIDLVSFDGAFRWIDLDPCANACLCVAVEASSPGDLTLTVESYSREL